MRGRDETDVDRDLGISPHGTHLAGLQDPEQLRLEREGHVSDLVEEQGAARRGDDQSAARPLGPGEGSAHVPEELGLQEVIRDRTAVDRHEGSPGSWARIVEGPGEHLLPGPALSEEQDRHVGGRGAVQSREELGHRGASRHDVLRPRTDGAELRGTSESSGSPDLLHELVALERLRQEREGASPRGPDRLVDRTVGGEDEDRERRERALQRLEERQPVHARHPQVGHHDRGGLPFDPLQGLDTAPGRADAKARSLEPETEDPEQVLVVVDDEHVGRGHGRRPRRVFPAGGREGQGPERSLDPDELIELGPQPVVLPLDRADSRLEPGSLSPDRLDALLQAIEPDA